MTDVIIIWDLEDDPDGNIQHIAEHGITTEEVEEVLHDREAEDTTSKSSGRPITFGYTSQNEKEGDNVHETSSSQNESYA